MCKLEIRKLSKLKLKDAVANYYLLTENLNKAMNKHVKTKALQRVGNEYFKP